MKKTIFFTTIGLLIIFIGMWIMASLIGAIGMVCVLAGLMCLIFAVCYLTSYLDK